MTLSALIAEWPPEVREHYEERAAIREYLGREPRDRAERAAEEEARHLYGTPETSRGSPISRKPPAPMLPRHDSNMRPGD